MAPGMLPGGEAPSPGAPRSLGPDRPLQGALQGPFMLGGRVIESVITIDPINGEIAFLIISYHSL